MVISKRLFVLTACPNGGSGELLSLFTNKEDGIKKKLEAPPLNAGKIRYSGWDMQTLDQGKIIDGQFVRVQNGERKTIDLYKDGVLIFTGLADGDFLAHASDDGLKINSIALIEIVYNFVSFYKEVIDDLSAKPESVSIEFKFINMLFGSQATYLVEGQAGQLFDSNKHDAQSNEFYDVINVSIKDLGEGKFGEITYEIVKKIYLKFGAPIDSGVIPYTKEQNSVISIDIEQIKKK
jgi:hypothetical protein